MAPVILWLACGLLAAWTASRKGRSGLAWFVLGSLLGPFGLLIFFLPDSLFGGKGPSTGFQGFKTCPHCNFNNSGDAVFCQQCGQKFS